MRIQKVWKNKKGIYKICLEDKCYVGSSKNLYDRLAVHLSHLRSNVHHSKYMQRCFNKYGEDKFNIDIIETYESISIEELREKELFFINSLNSVFNSTTPIYYEHSEEMKHKISETLKRKYKSGEIIHHNLNKGRKINVYNISGDLIHENISISDVVKILNISNRSVIYSKLRKKYPYAVNKQFIIMENNINYLDYLLTFLKETCFYCIYKVYKNGEFKKVNNNLNRLRKQIIKNNKDSLIYFSKKEDCFYTFPGLIKYAVQSSNVLNY